MVLQEKLALQEAAGLDIKVERDHLRDVRAQMERSLSELEKQLETSDAAHEAQRQELLAGIDERAGQLDRLNASMAAQRDQAAQAEHDRETLAAQLQARNDRLETITTVLTELEGKAKQALDLAKAVPN